MNVADSPDDLALATARLLSSETRLRLLRLLRAQTGGGALCVNALACRLGISQAAVSQHLKRFEELGLVHARPIGVRTHYYLDETTLEYCLGAINQALGSRSQRGGPPAHAEGGH